MDVDAIDLKYAREAAEFIGANHHEVMITREDVLQALPRVVACWAPTTSPPSGPASACIWCARPFTRTRTSGCSLPGRFSDELFGYKYTDFAPTPQAFQEESEKRVRSSTATTCSGPTVHFRELLEAGCPLGIWTLWSTSWVLTGQESEYLWQGKIPPAPGFPGGLPAGIHPYAEKAAFSDAVGHSMVDDLKEYAESRYTDEEFQEKCRKYDYARPFTKNPSCTGSCLRNYIPARPR